jgi:hypothetical protein
MNKHLDLYYIEEPYSHLHRPSSRTTIHSSSELLPRYRWIVLIMAQNFEELVYVRNLFYAHQ